jgi:hypothetical protein
MLKLRSRLVRTLGLLGMIVAVVGGGTALADPVAYEGHIGELSGVAELQGRYTYLYQNQPAMFSVHAWKDADGTVHGQYFAWLESLDLRIRGTVTCLNIQGNRAWVAGSAEEVWSSQDFNWVLASETWFQVFDNTDFNDAAAENADITTSIGADVAPAGTDWCNAMPEPRFPYKVLSGNVIVRDGQ